MSWRYIPGTNAAEQRVGSALDEIDLDTEGLSVRLESGTGYMHTSLDTHVPMSVLIELFRRAGFGVTELSNDTKLRHRT